MFYESHESTRNNTMPWEALKAHIDGLLLYFHALGLS